MNDNIRKPSVSKPLFTLWEKNTAIQLRYYKQEGFPGGSGKESACTARDLDSISGLGRSLEKEMVTHSSVLAWRIPWTEKSGRLQSMGKQRIGHD